MKKQTILDKGIPISIGTIKGTVFGGPFTRYVPGTRRLVGVKMAEEIDHRHDFKVDTRDFSVPTEEAMQKGILFGLQSLAEGKDIYVGCMGGIGRTGLYMACMAAVANDYAVVTKGAKFLEPRDPIEFVRKNYSAHAVETSEQHQFVDHFDTLPLVEWLTKYHEPVAREVQKTVYLGPIAWLGYAFRKWVSKNA